MHFGIFLEQMRKGVTQVEWFREFFNIVDAAETWGLDGVWMGEMQFNPTRSPLSASLAMAAAIASRTKRLRAGTAVQLLPLNHPLRTAQEVACVDQISEGRLDLGIGRSGSPRAYDAYRIPYEESQERFSEALEIMRLVWKGEACSFQGKFHSFENVTIAPRPYQTPHPPLRQAATTEETFPRVGKMGLPIFVGLRGMDIPELCVHLQAYRKAWRDAGHPGNGDVFVRIPVYAAPSEKEALEEPRETIMFYMNRQANLTRASMGRAGTGPIERRQSRADRLSTLTYEQVLDSKVAFGTAGGLIDRFKKLREQLGGLDGVVAELNPGGLLQAEQEKRSLHIITQQVMPAFR